LNLSPLEVVARLPPSERAGFIESLPPDVLARPWRFTARPNQVLPPGDWPVWAIVTGRGWGKTRSAAEGVIDWAQQNYPRIALVGRTAADVRDTMVEGESGILACSPVDFRPRYYPSRRLLVWPNGVEGHTYSAEEPKSLRGPQHHKAWCDEIAAWFTNDKDELSPKSAKRAVAAWDNLQMGLRLGDTPQAIATTTPQPVSLVRKILADLANHVTRGHMDDNRGNLPAKFLAHMKEKYGGTRLGRQELAGELLSDVPGALFTRDRIDGPRVRIKPDLHAVVIAVDPAVTKTGDETGIVAAGQGMDARGYLLEDLSANLSMQGWGQRAVGAYYKHQACMIVAERNNGGDLVEQNIRLIDPSVPVQTVWASRGKVKRAEPVALLYEQGKVSHVGEFDQLEDELCLFTPEGGFAESPNRADALVWAFWKLFIEQQEQQFTGARLPETQMISPV